MPFDTVIRFNGLPDLSVINVSLVEIYLNDE